MKIEWQLWSMQKDKESAECIIIIANFHETNAVENSWDKIRKSVVLLWLAAQ